MTTARDDPEYHKRHAVVWTHRGRADQYPCATECGRDAQEWSQIHGTDGWSPEHYNPMCCSCHQIYDDKWNDAEREKVRHSVANWHASLTEEERAERGRRISEAKKGRKRTPISDQARANQISGQRARRERERLAKTQGGDAR